jgi:hypothetical protein
MRAMPSRAAVSRSITLALVAGALVCSAACGGSVVTTGNGGNGGSGGSGSGGGPLAACGDQCSPDQVASACQDDCARIEEAGCSQVTPAECTMSCASSTTIAPTCAGLVNDYLRCAQGVTPTCTQAGDPVFPGCEAQQKAVSDCVNRNLPSVGGFGCSLTTNQCPSIPPPVGTATCSGSGSGGGGLPTTDMYSCQDSRGNVWAATCSGGTCTCTYNGGSACTCTESTTMGTCGSCCPGAG